jgi:hypothetical protein
MVPGEHTVKHETGEGWYTEWDVMSTWGEVEGYLNESGSPKKETSLLCVYVN